MAAITLSSSATATGLRRSATAQANTGQTDWLRVPSWAKYLDLILSLTAVAGTTPIADPSLLAADPITMDDANALVIAAFTTPPTTAGVVARVVLGPGLEGSGGAADLALAAAADSTAFVNTILPAVLGVRLTLDRTTGDETYTYDLTATFRS